MQATPTPHFSPNALFDTLMQRLQLNSDKALAQQLRLARHVIVNIRHGRIPLAASLLLLIEQQTGISVEELRRLMGDRRTKFRLSYQVQPFSVLKAVH